MSTKPVSGRRALSNGPEGQGKQSGVGDVREEPTLKRIIAYRERALSKMAKIIECVPNFSEGRDKSVSINKFHDNGNGKICIHGNLRQLMFFMYIPADTYLSVPIFIYFYI